MDEDPKFSVDFANLLCAALKQEIAKLELTLNLPLKSTDYGKTDEGACHSLIDSKTFLRCNEIQGALNKEKLSEDCGEIIRLLRDIVEELTVSQTFNKLITHVDATSSEILELYSVVTDFTNLNIAVKKLNENLKNQKKFERQCEDDVDSSHRDLKFKHQELEFEMELEKTFGIKWIEAQVRQQELRLLNDEKRISEKVFNVTNETCQMEEASFKICKFYNQKIKELQEDTMRMNAEYESRIENVEIEYQIALNEKRQLQQMIQSAHEKFAEREIELKNYHEMKQKKADDKRLRELQEIKIVVIQAWWRGAMVRHHLGKFKAFKKRAKKIKKEFRVAKAQLKKNKKRK